MTKNAIILHGRPDKTQWEDPSFPSTSNYYWLPWTQKQLALHNIPAETPEVPDAWIPKYETWRTTFEKHSVDQDTVLIGHSCGAGFIVRWLSENKAVTAGKVILVAPWVDPTGDPDNEDTVDFFDFDLDKELVQRTTGITIINSSNDAETIQSSVQRIREEIAGVKYIELVDRGHFFDNNAMQFPELIDEVLA